MVRRFRSKKATSVPIIKPAITHPIAMPATAPVLRPLLVSGAGVPVVEVMASGPDEKSGWTGLRDELAVMACWLVDDWRT